MPNMSLNIPAPAGDGVGAPVDVSAFGASKTIIVTGTWPRGRPIITIELNNDPLQAGTWAPFTSFQGNGYVTLDIACWWMRVRVQSFSEGTAPAVNVAGQNFGTSFVALVAPAGNGVGAAVDISTLPPFKTIHVGGTFNGTTMLEVSTDGLTEWAQVKSFTAPGQQSALFTANWARIRRVGVPSRLPGLPIVNVGAASSLPSTVSGVDVDDDGVPIGVGPYTLLNFTGGGVSVVDGGMGEATINVPGITVSDEGVPIAGAPHSVFNFTGLGITAVDGGAGVADINVPGGVSIDDDFVPLGFFTTLNLFGNGVNLVDGGGGELEVEIGGITFFDDGVPVPGAPHFDANFTGFGVTLTNPNPDEVEINIPTNPLSPPAMWVAEDIPVNANQDMSIAGVTFFNTVKMVRTGYIVALCTRLNAIMIGLDDMTIEVYIDGVPTGLLVVHNQVTNPQGGIATAAPGAILYNAGALIGLHLTSGLDLDPLLTDAAAWIEVQEPI